MEKVACMNEMMTSILGWAAQTPAASQSAPQGPAGGLPPMVFMITAIIILFYFMILRPQKKEQRKREELLGSVAKGDGVITVGGIHGTVESVDAAKGVVTVNVAPKISLRFSKSAISTVIKKSGAKKEGAEEGGGE